MTKAGHTCRRAGADLSRHSGLASTSWVSGVLTTAVAAFWRTF
jgi:hypothetical protein